MKTEQELENCLESFERRYKIELNPESKKMWNVLVIFCKFLLDRQGNMYYPDYVIKTDFDSPDFDWD